MCQLSHRLNSFYSFFSDGDLQCGAVGMPVCVIRTIAWAERGFYSDLQCNSITGDRSKTCSYKFALQPGPTLHGTWFSNLKTKSSSSAASPSWAFCCCC